MAKSLSQADVRQPPAPTLFRYALLVIRLKPDGSKGVPRQDRDWVAAANILTIEEMVAALGLLRVELTSDDLEMIQSKTAHQINREHVLVRVLRETILVEKLGYFEQKKFDKKFEL